MSGSDLIDYEEELNSLYNENLTYEENKLNEMNYLINLLSN